MSFWEKIWDGEKAEALPIAASRAPEPKTLEDALDCSWDYVKDKLFCYNLPYPRFVEGQAVTPTASINMLDQQIVINREFVEYLKARGLGHESSLKGLLSHEAGHHKIMPWDLKNLLMMLYTAEKISPKHKDAITNYFADICLNLDLVLGKREDSVRQVYHAMEKTSRVDTLICHLYQYKTGLDFAAPPLDPGLNDKLKSLKKIKFTNSARLYANLKKFASIMKEVLDEEQKKEAQTRAQEQQTNAQEKQTRKKGDYSVSDLDKFNIGSYDPNEVKKALKDIAGELDSPQKFREIYKFAKKVAKEGGMQGTAPTTDAGKKISDNLASLIDFYSAKADLYNISVSDRSVCAGGDSGKSELKTWEVDESTATVDIFNSYGRFFPGITRAWADSSDEGSREIKATPDLLVMIDSSGSMPNPAIELSCACLGSICAAKHYLKKGRKVAVANFGDTTKMTDFTDDFAEAAKGIFHYQQGGTELIADIPYKCLERHGKEVDILLLSDGYISNLDALLNKLEARAFTNRISLVQIDRGFGGGFSAYKQSGKMKVYDVKDEKDIPNLVVNDLVGGGC